MENNSNPVDRKIDLEKARDEKCIPIARSLLADLATDLLPEDANVKVDYNPIALKFLKAMFEADLNITIEVSYIFQLILGVFSGLNKTVQGATAVPTDDVRYAAIGKKVLGFLVGVDIKMNDVKPEDIERDFAPIKVKINELFAEEKLTMVEIKYVMDNIFESFTTVNNMVQKSLEISTARAEAKLFGIGAMDELTMKKLDSVLTEAVTGPKAEPAKAPEVVPAS